MTLESFPSGLYSNDWGEHYAGWNHIYTFLLQTIPVWFFNWNFRNIGIVLEFFCHTMWLLEANFIKVSKYFLLLFSENHCLCTETLFYIMWSQVTSSSCSLYFILRLHFSLRLPDTLQKKDQPLSTWPQVIYGLTGPFFFLITFTTQVVTANVCGGHTLPIFMPSVLLVWLILMIDFVLQTGEDLSKELWERLPPSEQIT